MSELGLERDWDDHRPPRLKFVTFNCLEVEIKIIEKWIQKFQFQNLLLMLHKLQKHSSG